MQISILDRQDNLTPEIHEFAERQLLFALSRFSAKITRVEVVITDVNGPRGGVDKMCSVLVKPRRLPDIRTSNSDADIEASIAGAAHRAGRTVARAIERSQHTDRRQPYVV